MMLEIEMVVRALKQKFQPLLIFLYGSRARGDPIDGSDWEVG